MKPFDFAFNAFHRRYRGQAYSCQPTDYSQCTAVITQYQKSVCVSRTVPLLSCCPLTVCLRDEVIVHIQRPEDTPLNSNRRLIWCPFIPEDNEENPEDGCQTLALLHEDRVGITPIY